jgi:hypothetical protein
MSGKDLHLADEKLLLYADEELSVADSVKIADHLATCDQCCARLEEVTGRLAEFSRAHRRALHSDLPPSDGARARLTAGLAELSAVSRLKPSFVESWFDWAASAIVPMRRGYVFASLVLVILMLAVYRREITNRSQHVSASLGLWAEPKTNLTPGATLALTKNQVCATSPVRIPAVPISLENEVLARYGVSGSQSNAYEVDYLITPELGGATDIQNLWPEPYYDTTWNAHVKDQLEDRLHEMVCHGDLDLTTAQKEISKDWIAAYRKYFHTDTPIVSALPSRT